MVPIKLDMKYLIINIFLTMPITIITLFLSNSSKNLVILGMLILLISIYYIVYFKNCGYITILVSIVALINILISFSVCFNPYLKAVNWQVALIETPHNIIMAKTILLFSTLFFMGLGNKLAYNNEFNYDNISDKKSLLVLVLGFLFLFYALIFGYDRVEMSSIEGYLSNGNPIYEYAIVVFTFLWIIWGENKKVKLVLIIYSVIYCLQALKYGDRSACIPMLISIYLLIIKKAPKVTYIIILSLGVIIFSNTVDIIRNQGVNNDILTQVASRGLNVNTVSYSFYAGTQIVRYSDMNQDNEHFIKYVKSIIWGKSSQLRLSTIARENGLINKGGGFYSSYLYYWGGYPFVIIIGFLTGWLIKKIINFKNKLNVFLSILIVVYAIRWYVYYPIALWRSALFIPVLLYVLYVVYLKALCIKK